MQVTEMKVMGDSDKEYVVSIVDGSVKCSCPAWQYSEDEVRVCKHMKFVSSLLLKQPRRWR